MDPQRDLPPHASPWILASSSPRRREMLAAAGQTFSVVPSRIEETVRDGEDAAAAATRLATEKALEVSSRERGRWVLGADTIVVVGERILGKPVDAEDARAMLALLSGREHRVITGFSLVAPGGRLVAARAVETHVAFAAIGPDAIDAYVRSGEPFDKAGAYAIQGGAAGFVCGIRGSWTNVVGLPIDEVEEELRAAGLWREPPERRT